MNLHLHRHAFWMFRTKYRVTVTVLVCVSLLYAIFGAISESRKWNKKRFVWFGERVFEILKENANLVVRSHKQRHTGSVVYSDEKSKPKLLYQLEKRRYCQVEPSGEL